jgi:hypothetical protein
MTWPQPLRHPLARLNLVAQAFFLLTAHVNLLLAGLLDSFALSVALPAIFLIRLALLAAAPRTALITRVGVTLLLAVPLYFRQNTTDPGLTVSAFLTVMLCWRVLWLAGIPDDWVCRLIASLQFVSVAFFSQSVLYLPLLVIFLLGGLVLATAHESSPPDPRQSPTPRAVPRLLRACLLLAAVIAPLTALFFALLPRTGLGIPGAWSRWPSNQRSGFGDSIELGRTGRIGLSNRAALRIREERGRRLDSLYWKGASLTEFHGQEWHPRPDVPRPVTLFNGQAWLVSHLPESRRGTALRYSVQILDPSVDHLFFAGYPELVHIDRASVFRAGDTFRAVGTRGPGGSYTAVSFLPAAGQEYPWNGLFDPRDRQAHLELPALDPRISALARQWTAGVSGPRAQAARIEANFIRTFAYSLDLPADPVPDPLAHFLFQRRAGHCEYFAAAMAVMLRTLAIPSRVAVGYHGGTFNPLTGYHVLRGQDAHSWVEAWIEPHGWVAFDPTPFGSPSASPDPWQRLALFTDALETGWRDWVVGYDLTQQIALMLSLERGRQQSWANASRALESWFRRNLPLLLAGLALAAVVLAFRFLRRSPRLREPEAARLYRHTLRRLERRGWKRLPNQTASEFARSIPDPGTRILFERFLALYHRARFAHDPEALHQARLLASQFGRALPRP